MDSTTPQTFGQFVRQKSIYALPPDQRLAEFDAWTSAVEDQDIRSGAFDNPEDFQKWSAFKIQKRMALADEFGNDPAPEAVQAEYNNYTGAFQKTLADFSAKPADKKDNEIYKSVLDGKQPAAFVRGQIVFNPAVVKDPAKYREALANTDAPNDIKAMYAGMRQEQEKNATITRRNMLAKDVVTPELSSRLISALQESTEMFGLDLGDAPSADPVKNEKGEWTIPDPDYVDPEAGLMETFSSRYLPLGDAQRKPIKALADYQAKYGLTDDEVKEDFRNAFLASSPTKVGRWFSDATSVEDYAPILKGEARVLNKDVAPMVFVPNPNLAFDKEAYEKAIDDSDAPDDAKQMAKASREEVANQLAVPVFNLLQNNRDDFRDVYAREAGGSKTDMAAAISRYYRDKKDQAWYDDVGELFGQFGTGVQQGIIQMGAMPDAIRGMLGNVDAADRAAMTTRYFQNLSEADAAVAAKTAAPTLTKFTRDFGAIVPDLVSQIGIGLATGGAGNILASSRIAAQAGVSNAAAKTALRVALTTPEKAVPLALTRTVQGLAPEAINTLAQSAINVAKYLSNRNIVKGFAGKQLAAQAGYAGLSGAALTFADVYGRMKEAGYSKESAIKQARTAAVVSGAITSVLTYGFSAFGAGGIEDVGMAAQRKAGEFTVGDLVKAGFFESIKGPEGKRILMSAARGFLKNPAQEGVEDGLDQFLQGVAAYATDPTPEAQNKTMSDIMSESIYAAGLGATAGGAASLGQFRSSAGGLTAQQMQQESIGARALKAGEAPIQAPFVPSPTQRQAVEVPTAPEGEVDRVIEQLSGRDDTQITAAALQEIANTLVEAPAIDIPKIETGNEAPFATSAEPVDIQQADTTSAVEESPFAEPPAQPTPEAVELESAFRAATAQPPAQPAPQQPEAEAGLTDLETAFRRATGKEVREPVVAQPEAEGEAGGMKEMKLGGAAGTQQKRAAAGGEFGPNGEWYPGGAFIATTEMPKKQKERLRKMANSNTGVQVRPGVRESIAPGLFSPYKVLGGTAVGPQGNTNEEFLSNPLGRLTGEWITQARKAIERWNNGENQLPISEFPALANPDALALAIDSGVPIPGAVFEQQPWTKELVKRIGSRTPSPSPEMPEKPSQTIIGYNAQTGAEMPVQPEAAGEAIIQRDPAKPEQMTPEERIASWSRASAASERLNASKSLPREEIEKIGVAADKQLSAYLKSLAISGAGSTIETRAWNRFSNGIRKAIGAMSLGQSYPMQMAYSMARHARHISAEATNFSPVSSVSVDTYGIKLPEGYVKQGDLYIYQPQPPQQDAAKTMQIGQGNQQEYQPVDEGGSRVKAGDSAAKGGKTKKEVALPKAARKAGVSQRAKSLGITSGDSASVAPAVQKIASDSNAPKHLQKAAADIAPLLEENPVAIEYVSSGNDVNGWFDPRKNTVYINLDGPHEMGLDETILHEIQHAVGDAAINNPTTDRQKKFAESIKQQRANAEKAARKLINKKLGKGAADMSQDELIAAAAEKNDPDFFDIVYGLSDDFEFHTHARTSRAFQNFLSGISQTGEQLSAFRKFVNSVARFFTGNNIAPGSAAEKVYSDLLELTPEKGELRNGERPLSRARTKAITPDQDAEYLAAVEAGDMETAQRMVDAAAKAAGYEVGFWHGTNAEFSEFDPEKTARGTRNEGEWMAFATKNKEAAEVYGKPRRWALKWNRMLSLDEAEAAIQEDIKDRGSEPLYRDNLTSADDSWRYASIEDSEDSFEGQFSDIPIPSWNWNDVLHSKAEEVGADSFVVWDGAYDALSVAVLNPSQIKSAAPVTYDESGNVIPLSKRFQESSDDIRFSRARSIINTQIQLLAPDADVVEDEATKGIEFSGDVIHYGNVDGLEDFEIRKMTNRAIVARHAASGDPVAAAIIQEQSLVVPQQMKPEVAAKMNAALLRARDFAKREGLGDIAMEISDRVSMSLARAVTPEQDAEYLSAVNAGDMQAAQAMVDEAANSKLRFPRDAETGEIIKLQHDTPEDFTVFKPGGYDPAQSGRAIWLGVFGSSLKAGHRVGSRRNPKNRTLSLYADLKNPLVLDSKDMVDFARAAFMDGESDFKKREFPFLISDTVLERIKSDGYDGIIYDRVEDRAEMQKRIDEHVKQARRLGLSEKTEQRVFDKVEVIAFNPNQIKSADPVTYDDAGNIIPLSQRFRPESPDIRYSKARKKPQPIVRVPITKKIAAAFTNKGLLTEAGYEAFRKSEQAKKATNQLVSFLTRDLIDAVRPVFGTQEELVRPRLFYRNGDKWSISTTKFASVEEANKRGESLGADEFVVATPQTIMNTALGSNAPTLTAAQQAALEKAYDDGMDAIRDQVDDLEAEYIAAWDEYMKSAKEDDIDPKKLDSLRERKRQWKEALRLQRASAEEKLRQNHKEALRIMLEARRESTIKAKEAALRMLPESIVNVLNRSRKEMDKYSMRLAGIDWIMGEGEMRLVFDSLLGIYVTRSYEAFESESREDYANWLNEAYIELMGNKAVSDKLAASRVAPMVKHLRQRIIKLRAQQIIKEDSENKVRLILDELLADPAQVSQVAREDSDYESLMEAAAKGTLTKRRQEEKKRFIKGMASILIRDGFGSEVEDIVDRNKAAAKEAERIYRNRGDQENRDYIIQYLGEEGFKYAKMTDEDALDIAEAEAAMEGEAGLSGAPIWKASVSGDIHNSLNAAINDDFQRQLDFITGAPLSMGAMDARQTADWKVLGDKILENKKNIPEFLRKFWGEHEDTALRITETLSKQGFLSAQAEFFRDFAEVGKREGWLVSKEEFDKNRNTKYKGWRSALSSDTRDYGYEANPMRGMYIDPIIKDAIDEFQMANEPMNTAFKGLFRMVAISLWGATAGSVKGFIRNMFSIPAFILNSGGISILSPAGWKDWLQRAALSQGVVGNALGATSPIDADPNSIWKKGYTKILGAYAGNRWVGTLSKKAAPNFQKAFGVKPPSSEGLQKFWIRAVNLGVGNDNIQKEGLLRIMGAEDLANRQPVTKPMGKLAQAMKLNKAETGLTYAKDTLARMATGRAQLYGSADDFGKSVIWLKELDNQAKIHAESEEQYNEWKGDGLFLNLPEEYAKIAADKVTSLVQSYGRKWSVLNKLQKKGFGVVFAPFVSFRAESIRNAINAYRIGFDEIRNGKNAIEKQVGLARVVGAMTAHLLFTTMVKALYTAVFNIMGMIAGDDDEGERGTAEEEDLLRSLVPDWAKNRSIAFRRFKDGRVDWFDVSFANPFSIFSEAVIAAKREMSDAEVEDRSIMSAIGSMGWEFLSPFIKPQIAVEAGSYALAGYDPVRGYNIWNEGDDPATKAFKGLAYYIKSAATSGDYKEAEKILKALNGTMERGQSYQVGTQLLSILLGASVKSQTIPDMLEAKLKEVPDALAAAKAPLYTSVLRNANNVDREEVEKGVKKAASQEKEALRRAAQQYDAAKKLLEVTGGDESALRRILTGDTTRLSKDAERAIRTGVIPAYNATKAVLEKVKELGAKNGDDRLNWFKNALSNQ